MLKFRKRRTTAVTTEATGDPLKIRDLLDDPHLRAILGDAAAAPAVRPVDLDWSGSGRVHRPRFGRRRLAHAA